MALLRCILLVFATIACHVDIAAATVTFPNGPYTASISEKAAVGTTVATVTATTTASDTLAYTLVSQAPVTNSLIFAIDGGNGEITVVDATHLDYETHTEYTLTIKAAESNSNTETATTTVTVHVTANKPPAFAETTYTACVNKDSPAGTTVVQITATDEDGDTLSYAITAGDNDGIFEVSEATGIIKIAVGKTVSDTSASYSLTLDATDDDTLSGTTMVSVTVGDPCPAPDNSAMTAAIPFHALLASALILLCQFFMKF